MKTITMDYGTYVSELRQAKAEALPDVIKSLQDIMKVLMDMQKINSNAMTYDDYYKVRNLNAVAINMLAKASTGYTNDEVNDVNK